MKNKKMKTVFVIICLIIIVFGIKSLFTPSSKEEKDLPKETSTETEQTEVESIPVTEKSAEPELQTEEVEHRTGDNIIGVSDKDIKELKPVFFKSVINDVTGNWRYATISSNVDIEEYALSYYKNYFKSDNEVHGIVNFTRKTTTRITCSGGILTVSILDYVDGEEHDAKLMYSGQLLETYYVYTDNGDIEKAE
ncbi:hypothetical protein [Lacrimispora indolis]|uniref:hypothetical protein n=1 Tax=Lacrimispora indolis TaxID=69825 RepID=UPI0004185DD3|nr:hypothetical protein [[Clostridium] methoxybenzovorans]